MKRMLAIIFLSLFFGGTLHAKCEGDYNFSTKLPPHQKDLRGSTHDYFIELLFSETAEDQEINVNNFYLSKGTQEKLTLFLEKKWGLIQKIGELLPETFTCDSVPNLLSSMESTKNKLPFLGSSEKNYISNPLPSVKGNPIFIFCHKSENCYIGLLNELIAEGGFKKIYKSIRLSPQDEISKAIYILPKVNSKKGKKNLYEEYLKGEVGRKMNTQAGETLFSPIDGILMDNSELDQAIGAFSNFRGQRDLLGEIVDSSSFDLKRWDEIAYSLLSKFSKLHHQEKYCFLDIKPDNILIDDANCSIPIDFGFCMSKQEIEEEECNEVFGTKGMIAPEMLSLSLNKERIFHSFKKLDSFALGLTLYMAITVRVIYLIDIMEEWYKSDLSDNTNKIFFEKIKNAYREFKKDELESEQNADIKARKELIFHMFNPDAHKRYSIEKAFSKYKKLLSK